MDIPNLPRDDSSTAFPANAETPGQVVSRSAYTRFVAIEDKCPWWHEWRLLREEGWNWREAAVIAWEASPVKGRWPEKQQELALNVLGLKSDRVIRRWKGLRPQIEERIARLKVEPLLRYRADVIMALVEVASTADPRAHPDRRMFLEMTGDYRGESRVEIAVPDDARQRLARLLGAEDDAGSETEGAGEP
jgi:hypothetical protein